MKQAAYREIFERVKQQAQGQLGFVQQGLCLRDAGESAAEHPAQGMARGEGQKYTSIWIFKQILLVCRDIEP